MTQNRHLFISAFASFAFAFASLTTYFSFWSFNNFWVFLGLFWHTYIRQSACGHVAEHPEQHSHLTQPKPNLNPKVFCERCLFFLP